jgi:predicted ATPase
MKLVCPPVVNGQYAWRSQCHRSLDWCWRCYSRRARVRYLEGVLTRLEVDGFKNLLGFTADFGPYSCIAGPNAVGKSNIFDAIEFLSSLASSSLMGAALDVRITRDRSGDPRTLFWADGDKVREMSLAAEMFVPAVVSDDFGRSATPSVTYLRYEIRLRYNPRGEDSRRGGELELLHEALYPLSKKVARAKLPWASKVFLDAAHAGTKKSPFISTVEEEGSTAIQIHGDGGPRGRGQRSPARNAPRTIVATTTTLDAPTVLAAKREMQSWKKLALEPSAMRSPDQLGAEASVGSDGSHLPAVLYRLANKVGDDVYTRIANRVSALADVRRLTVDLDPQRDTLTVEAAVGIGPMLPARALSEGTLRFIALCVIEEDAEIEGLLCMEEPENGIHPARIAAMVDIMRGLAVDPEEAPSDINPFRQVIVNTHSPFYVSLHEDEELLVATSAVVKSVGGSARTLRLLPMKGSWRAREEHFVGSRQTIADYLAFPEYAPQLESAESVA